MRGMFTDPSNFCAVNCWLFAGITVGDRQYLLVCQHLQQRVVLCALGTDSGRLVTWTHIGYFEASFTCFHKGLGMVLFQAFPGSCFWLLAILYTSNQKLVPGLKTRLHIILIGLSWGLFPPTLVVHFNWPHSQTGLIPRLAYFPDWLHLQISLISRLASFPDLRNELVSFPD